MTYVVHGPYPNQNFKNNLRVDPEAEKENAFPLLWVKYPIYFTQWLLPLVFVREGGEDKKYLDVGWGGDEIVFCKSQKRRKYLLLGNLGSNMDFAISEHCKILHVSGKKWLKTENEIFYSVKSD